MPDAVALLGQDAAVSSGGALDVTATVDVLRQCGATLLRGGAGQQVVLDVLLQVAGDPALRAPVAVLWADVQGPVPDAPVVVVRASAVGAADRLPPGTAVLTVPDGERWSDLHERLRGQVLAPPSGADLFAMADALALSVGGAVAVEDVDRRILAFSTVAGQPIDEVRRQGILGRRVPEHVERDPWYAQLWRSTAPVHFEAGPESWPRLALGLGAPGEPVGSVWVVGDRATLQLDSEATLVASAPGFTTAVLAVTGTRGRSREQRNRLVDRVLRQQQAPELDPRVPAVVVGIDCPSGSDLDDLRRARLSDVLSLRAQRTEGTGLAGELGRHVYGVLPWTSEERIEAALASLLQRTGVDPAAVVVSEPVAPGAGLSEAHAQVASLLDLARPDVPEVRFVSRSRPLVQLIRVGAALASQGALPSAGAATIAASDAEHGTRYAESLLAWLDAHGDVTRAAARLHVHGNTLRYRWNRAVQLFGLDLEDGEARLLLHLDLRLRELGYQEDEP